MLSAGIYLSAYPFPSVSLRQHSAVLCCHTLGSGSILSSPHITVYSFYFIFTTKLMRSLLHTLAVLGPFRLLFPPFSFFVFKLSHILTHLPSPFQFHNSSLSFSLFLLLPLSVDVHESPP